MIQHTSHFARRRGPVNLTAQRKVAHRFVVDDVLAVQYEAQQQLRELHSAGQLAAAGRALHQIRALFPESATGICRRALGSSHADIAEQLLAAADAELVADLVGLTDTWSGLVAVFPELVAVERDVLNADVPLQMEGYSRAYDTLVTRRLERLLNEERQREIADDHLRQLWSGRAAQLAMNGVA